VEFLNAINLEQLGTAGLFIAYLIWQNRLMARVIDKKETECMHWQNKAFDVSRDSQKEMFESAQIFEKTLAALKN